MNPITQTLRLLLGSNRKIVAKPQAFGQAPVNIALIKYWGKSNSLLNLPLTSSLSISINACTRTWIRLTEGFSDSVILNGEVCNPKSSFFLRTQTFLDGFRTDPWMRFQVETRNEVPTAAGLASSASGFAALVLALNDLFQWNLSLRNLSILARLGSGSATRSLFSGFVQWHKGNQSDGLDSYAETIAPAWPELRLGILVIQSQSKKISSREGMNHTLSNSPLSAAWPIVIEKDLQEAHFAIKSHDFEKLGQISEWNSLAMHSLMLSARPPLVYWMPETLTTLQLVWKKRQMGQFPGFVTIDAGPNPKILFRETDQSLIQEIFPTLQVYPMV
jgi:diphosphomevalonate decarboxylase